MYSSTSLTPSCSTESCTWLPYKSPGSVRGLCGCFQPRRDNEIRLGEFEYGDIPGAWRLPNGTGLLYPPNEDTPYPNTALMNVSNTWSATAVSRQQQKLLLPTTAFPDHGPLLLDMFILWPGIAVECTLRYCVKMFEASVKDGKFVEVDLETIYQHGRHYGL
jgi:hypothetical protein